MNPLSRILDETLRKLDLTEAADGARAVMLWPEIVGEQMAAASEARAIRAGTLHVVTRSSAWSQELSFQKSVILRRFRDRLGSDAVRDLRFTVGKVRGAAAAVPKGAPDEEVRRIRL